MAATLRPIAVDAMGGDGAPDAVVRGALRATGELGVPVILVGPETRVRAALEAAGGVPAGALSVVDAPDVIDMHEHPAGAVRAKPDASIVRTCALVADGRAAAAVSAGNSGAMLAAALFTLRRIRGVSRPAIGALLPSGDGNTFVLDVGANTDCRAEWLAQFAVMGDAYARTLLGIERPRVGLLSNGEEAEKGSELVQAAHALIRALPLDFTGNVEGSDVFRGRCDVVVTDGFTGNVALKTAEGVGEFLFATIRREARASLAGMLGGALLKSRLRPLRDRVDYRKTGGALLLGVAGDVVIAHGRSDTEAILNAIRVARDAANADVSGTIAAALEAAVTRAAGDAEGGSRPSRSAAPVAPGAGEGGGVPTAAGPAASTPSQLSSGDMP
jgi:glycerol-3-phosphate acyltransferase PlsX